MLCCAVGLPCAGIKNFHVRHNEFEFAKQLPDVKRPKKGVVAQCIDCMWASLDKFIPLELSNKSGTGNTMNENIFAYLYAWVWRYHLPTKANFKKELVKICWQSSSSAVSKKQGRKQHMWKHNSGEFKPSQNKARRPRPFTNAWPCFDMFFTAWLGDYVSHVFSWLKGAPPGTNWHPSSCETKGNVFAANGVE